MKPTYEELAQRVQMLEQSAQTRKESEKALKKRLVYEKMVADISTLAVMVEDLGGFVDRCLKRMADNLDVCRIFIDAYNPQTETLDTSFEWKAGGFPSAKVYFRNIPAHYFQWVVDATRENKIVDSYFTIVVENTGHLEKILSAVKKVKLVQDVKRIG